MLCYIMLYYFEFNFVLFFKETIICIREFLSVFLEEKTPPKAVDKELSYTYYDEYDFMLYWKQTQSEVPELK